MKSVKRALSGVVAMTVIATIFSGLFAIYTVSAAPNAGRTYLFYEDFNDMTDGVLPAGISTINSTYPGTVTKTTINAGTGDYAMKYTPTGGDAIVTGLAMRLNDVIVGKGVPDANDHSDRITIEYDLKNEHGAFGLSWFTAEEVAAGGTQDVGKVWRKKPIFMGTPDQYHRMWPINTGNGEWTGRGDPTDAAGGGAMVGNATFSSFNKWVHVTMILDAERVDNEHQYRCMYAEVSWYEKDTPGTVYRVYNNANNGRGMYIDNPDGSYVSGHLGGQSQKNIAAVVLPMFYYNVSAYGTPTMEIDNMEIYLTNNAETPAPAAILVKADEETVIGNSSFVWNEKDMKENTNGYDGTISMATWGNNIRNGEVTINVEKAGTYSIDVNAVINLTLDGASPMSFKIDDGAETTLTTGNTTVSNLNPSWTAKDGWTVKKISYTGDFVLDEGTHTLTFIIPRRAAGDVVIYAFDCATIIPKNNLATVSRVASTTLGNASFTWSHNGTKNSEAAYDGTYTKFDGGGATITATKTFYVEEEYEYELEVYAASSATHKSLSDIEFKIDNGSSTVLSSSNSTVSGLSNPCRTDAPWITKSIEYNRNIVLSKGMHTITFTVPQNSNGRTEAYFVFDCATIRPTDNSLKISEFDCDIAIAIGMTTQIVVKDNMGTVITSNMVDSITYASSSTKVATVDSTGLVRGVSVGTTRITVTIKENVSSKPITQTVDISVSKLLISGFAIEGKIIPNNTIYAKATVGDFSGKSEELFLAVALYRGERLEDVQVDKKACGVNTNYSASITLPEDLDNCSVKAFLWDSQMCSSGRCLTANSVANLTDFVIDITENREPVILHISDPQIIDVNQERYPERLDSGIESYWGSIEKMEQNCFSYIRETVEETNPDLILVTGDIIYGEFDDNGTSLQKFIEFMETLNTPWAPIFGNHDNESNMGADWQCAQLEAAENCLFKQRTLTGNGNYSIGIKQNGKLNRVIFMLDSNGCSNISQASKQNGHSKSSAGFGNDQIVWYTENANAIKEYYEDVKFTFAFHIQTNKFATAFEKYGYSNGTPINIDYHSNKEDTDFGIIGARLKGPWDSNDSITNGMIALGADSILVGHEHANSASVVYEGVRYQYGQKCSVYDRNNYVAADGTIVYSSYSDKGDPIMGGTVMKLSKTDGAISDAYIYYCDTSDDAGEGGGVYCPTPNK